MSFYTSLTGLNGAQADIASISNNIANVGTTGFKRSRAEFGDIFATSPLQAASSAIGSGTILKSIKQQFTQGNIESSLNALDLAISGQGFFALKPSLTSTQTVYTRNGAFSVNNDRYVVDSQGQLLQVFPVNDDGSVIATGIQSAKNLQLPTTSGLPKASQTIQLGLNLPADAEIIPNKTIYNDSNPYRFDKTNSATYNKSTSITIYDSLGNPTIATIYYVKTSNATETSPTNKWQTHVFVGDREVTPQLITSKDDQGKSYYINKFGQITTEPQSVDPTFNAAAAHPLYKQDDQNSKTNSTSAQVVGGIIKATGFDFGDTDANKVRVITDPAQYTLTREGNPNAGANPPYWGKDMFTISVDGSEPQSISINAGEYTGTQLAAELTRAVNAKFSGEKYFRVVDTYRKDGGTVVPGNDIIQLNLSKLGEDGSSVPLAEPIEIDLLGTGGSEGTPQVGHNPQGDNSQQLTREELVSLAQTKLNDALNKRRLEFGKPANWPDASNPPILVGYDVGARALTFTVQPSQLGSDANEPASRFNSVQVFNPTSATNDLGLPSRSASSDTLIRANTVWTGLATLPSGDPILDPREQRTGINVTYNKDTRQFVFSSGSTGETSSITVGRAELATESDHKAQIDSFDFNENQDLKYDTDMNVELEIDGRKFSYNYMGATGKTATDLFNGIEQSIPVSFQGSAEEMSGTTANPEVQSIDIYGNLFDGDAFTMDLALPNAISARQVKTAPLAIPAGTTESDRLDILTTALQDAIDADVGATGLAGKVSVEHHGNKFTFSYTNPGPVGPLVKIVQNQRGSDAGLPPITFTDRTVTTSLNETIQGNTTTPTVQKVSLKSVSGNSAELKTGDVYRLSVPLSDGSVAIKDVTLLSDGMDGLVEAANAAFITSNTKSDPNFSVTDSSKNSLHDTLSASYLQNGPVTGSMKVEQIKAEVGSVTSSSVVGTATKTTIGATAASAVTAATEVETIDLVDASKLAANQSFNVSIKDLTGTSQTASVTLTAGTRADLITQLNTSSLATYVVFAADVSSANKISMTYIANGTIASAATFAQASSTYSVPGTPDLSPTVSVTTQGVTAVAAVTAAAEVQSLNLGNSVGNLAVGDVFSVTLPKTDGSTQTVSVTLTAGTRANLIEKLNDSALHTSATFSADPNNASKIVITYASTGAVSGVTTFSQMNNPTMVRPDYIGPISITHSGSNLEIQGNPDGTSFNLNMRINGVVKASLPVGAQGSTSRNGLQVGQAKTISYAGSNELLGVGGSQSTRFVAGTGLASSAATAVGTRAITPMSQTFFLNESLGENQMTFTVDGIVGTVSLPVRAYTGDTFAAAIQDRVNQIQDPKTGRIVSGVTVRFDPDNNRLVFTSGTTGPNSQINVVGHPNFGLGNVTQTPGSVPTITNLKQATDEQGNKLYVDSNGTITTQAPSTEQNWYPLYLTEGQLTFDTIGKLISPKEGVIYSPFDPQNGSDLLRLNIDYGKYSTQFSSPFSVLSLSQDGYPSGSLNGLDIDAGGTVRANYTNGQTVALGKVMIANFANPNGLKQVGNANYVATSTSGQVVLGQAGADGFGTIKAGALERSNVDITQELVNLITSQRNFQANAKAIETTEQLSQTIIQIRG